MPLDVTPRAGRGYQRIDWLFNGAGDFEAAGELIPAELPEKCEGYVFFNDVKR